MDQDSTSSILIVDDDEEFLLYVRMALQGEGYEVCSAASSAAAIKLINNRRFPMILTDLRLPGASGLDLLCEARKIDPLTVGIALTGHSSLDTALEALREGAYDYLVKPCALDVLLPAIRRGLEYYRLKLALINKTAKLEELELELLNKSTMMQNVSHELKNPLSVVYGYSAFLLKQPPGQHKPEDLHRSLQSIHMNAERLGHLLEDLIESSRLASHKIELRPEAMAADKLCREAVDSFGLEAQQRKIKLECGLSLAVGRVRADPKRVHQIFSNLLINALKFTPEGGRITVSAVEDAGFIQFCVKDTGIGVSTQDLPRLFERFYQSEGARKKKAGMGLGLDICRGLVELHGGRIRAESKPGEGSSFYFTLPVSPKVINR